MSRRHSHPKQPDSGSHADVLNTQESTSSAFAMFLFPRRLKWLTEVALSLGRIPRYAALEPSDCQTAQYLFDGATHEMIKRGKG